MKANIAKTASKEITTQILYIFLFLFRKLIVFYIILFNSTLNCYLLSYYFNKIQTKKQSESVAVGPLQIHKKYLPSENCQIGFGWNLDLANIFHFLFPLLLLIQ